MCCSCGGGTIIYPNTLTSGIAVTYASFYPTLCDITHYFDDDGYSSASHDTCVDTNSNSDSAGNGCPWYDDRYSGSGCPNTYDVATVGLEFNAATDCCACGGGSTTKSNDSVIRVQPPTTLDEIGTYKLKTSACYTNFPDICSP